MCAAYVKYERRIDDIEIRLKEKMITSSGFAELENIERKLLQSLKFFDKTNSGRMNFQNFFSVLTHLNFFAVQSDIEGLFSRFDENFDGNIDYHIFSKTIMGFNGSIHFDEHFKNILYKLIPKILEHGGASGMHNFVNRFCRMTSSRLLDHRDIVDVIRDYRQGTILDSDIRVLLTPFTSDGLVDISQFLKVLRRGISLERKQSTLDIFRRFDTGKEGAVTVIDLFKTFDCASHPSVHTGVTGISPYEAQSHFLAHLEDRNVCTWSEFLDYHKGISMAIEDNNVYDLTIRNMWSGRNTGQIFISAPRPAATLLPSLLISDRSGNVEEMKKSSKTLR